jgi:ribosome-associated protein
MAPDEKVDPIPGDAAPGAVFRAGRDPRIQGRPLSLERVVAAARAAASKTLEETVVLDVGDLIGITDHFVVTSGRNDRQVRAIVDEVTGVLKAMGASPLRREGGEDASWVLLDYGDFVVHVLGSEARAYYGLERLWSDARPVAWDEPVASGRSASR